jgi:hypothetical protein
VPFRGAGLDKRAGLLEIASLSLDKLDTQTILFTNSDGDEGIDTFTVGSS